VAGPGATQNLLRSANNSWNAGRSPASPRIASPGTMPRHVDDPLFSTTHTANPRGRISPRPYIPGISPVSRNERESARLAARRDALDDLGGDRTFELAAGENSQKEERIAPCVRCR